MSEQPVYGPFISRKQAQGQGLKHYFTGKPCKNSHVAPRFTRRGLCVDCNRAHNRRLQAAGYYRDYYAERMGTDERFRLSKSADTRRHYHKYIKTDPEKMRVMRDRNKRYAQTEEAKASQKKRMDAFIASGKKAVSDRKYSQTAGGRATHRFANNNYRMKVKETTGMSGTARSLAKNPQQKIHSRLNTRMTSALFSAGVRKAHNTEELVGCSIKHLMEHLEKQFTPGMNSANHVKWHIDHIRPCASFDLTDLKQQRQCFHYSNLQPLWARDNIEKADNKWEEEAV